MAEKRITYKSIGFTLGLGGKGSGAVPAKAASSCFLDTLISSVPSAKAMLPTIAPGLLKPTAAEGSKGTGQLNEGLPPAQARSSAGGGEESVRDQIPSRKQNSEQLGVEQQQPTDNSKGATPRATAPAITVISLLTDSESATPQEAIPKAAQATATSPEMADVGGEGATGTKPSSIEFIPLPLAASATTHRTSNAIKIAAPGSADELAEQEDIRRLGERPYWMSYVSQIDSPLLRLHQELLELCELVQPTPDEAAARREAVAAVSEVICSIWPQAKCEVFGSYATGLYVPTSDIDLVILDSSCSNVQSGLKALGNALNSRKVAQSIQVVGKARVPIVKFETVGHGNLAFDVSFDVANGPQAAMLVSEMTATWPMMRPMILCLKLFLQQRELNEVYTGGIGSYALVTLVAAFLQLHGSRRPKPGPVGSQQQTPPPVYGTSGDAAIPSLSGGVEPGLGTLLVDFFRFYGRVLNMNDVGVSCACGGQFFRKVDKEAPLDVRGAFDGWLNEDRAYLLSVEDPKDSDNDICRNSFNVMRARTAFEFAYQMLTAPSRPHESLLARILRLGPILASRPRPAVPHLRELGYYAEPPSKENQLDRINEQQRNDRKQQQQQQQQQETPGGQVRKDRGHGTTPGGSNGAGSSRKKRAREKSMGGDGDGLGAKQGRKAGRARGQPGEGGRTAQAEPTSAEAKMQRKQQLKEERKARRKQRKVQQKTDAQPSAGGGDGGGGGGGGGRRAAPKRRREEATPSRGTAAGNATPARSAKRARNDGQTPQQQQQSKRQQQQNTPQNRRKLRDGGNRPSQQQDKQEGQQTHHHSIRQQQPNQHHQSQAQQQRRPALMQVTVQQSAPAPLFHPGYAPPPTNHDHRRHHSSQQHLSQQHQSSRGGGGGGSSNNGHHQNHHSHDGHIYHHSYNRQEGGYYGGDGLRDGYDANGGGGQGMYSQAPPPMQQREWERARAPLTLTPRHEHRQQPQQQRGQHHQFAQRTHTFYD